MNSLSKKSVKSLYLSCIVFGCLVGALPQQLPEIKDQYDNTTKTTKKAVDIATTTVTESNIVKIEENKALPKLNGTKELEVIPVSTETITKRIYGIITKPLLHIISIPKVNIVLRNVGTCVVNGAMELITYYFPPPLIPLIATAAGMMIPFEPVVMLREKMPVTSYRRAFKKALNSFLGTFDRYKLEDEDDDPYMTRRFNRRLMNSDSEDKNNV